MWLSLKPPWQMRSCPRKSMSGVSDTRCWCSGSWMHVHAPQHAVADPVIASVEWYPLCNQQYNLRASLDHCSLLPNLVKQHNPANQLSHIVQTALKIACSAHAPRQQVEFVIYKLAKRLTGETWLVRVLHILPATHRRQRCACQHAQRLLCKLVSYSRPQLPLLLRC